MLSIKNRRLPPMNAIRAFESAARHLSFSHAAQELHVTHSAISQQVKLLESWLEINLFIRKNNGLVLTEQGRQYLPSIRHILDTLHDATEQIQSQKIDVVLTISVLPNFAIHWLIPKLHSFQKQYPRIKIKIISASLSLDTLYESCDLAIRPFQPMTNYRFDWLCSARLMPVLSPALQKKHQITTPKDLQDLPKIHITHSPEDWVRWLNIYNLTDESQKNSMAFDSHAVALEAATHGLGVLMGQTPFINHLLEQQRLIAPFTESMDSGRSWYLVSTRSGLPNKADLFRQWLLTQVDTS